jgi:hypothetical protein
MDVYMPRTEEQWLGISGTELNKLCVGSRCFFQRLFFFFACFCLCFEYSFHPALTYSAMASKDPPEHRPTRSRLSIEFTTARHEASSTRIKDDVTSGLPDLHLTPLPVILGQFMLANPSHGLLSSQLPALKTQYGRNEITPLKRNPLWMFISFVFGGFNGFLWVAAILCFVSWRLGGLVRRHKFQGVQKSAADSIS